MLSCMTIIAVKKTFKTIIAVKKTLILCKRFKDISYFSRMRSLVGYAHAPVLHVAFVSALALARGFCPWLLHCSVMNKYRRLEIKSHMYQPKKIK